MSEPHNPEDYCYRHPDRRSYVLCQRCLRTVCPECQTQAAVGVICPECMKAQQQATPPRVRRAAASMRRLDSRPIVTYWIIGISAAMFVLQLLVPNRIVDELFTFYAPLLYPSLSGAFEPWRLLTGALLHGSFWHLALNMLALWMLGRSLEPLLGRVRFLALYVIGALGGSVGVALLAFGTPVVGASGAIFALFGALLVIGRHIGANISGIAIILGINLVLGFVPGFNVAWQAHVGGLIAGALVGLVLARTRSAGQRGLQIALLIAIAGGLLALLLVPIALYA